MLSLSSEDYFLEEADSHIQANLEDSVVQAALKSGVDLREYSAQVEKELKDVENRSIQDYIRESQNIASLHNQIAHCDQILERMETMLLSFQSDLGNISTEILSLQQESVQMNLKLRNRQAVRGELSQFVNDMLIPEQMITTLVDTPVTESEFLDQLLNLEQKITFLKEQSFRDARSCLDVRDVVEKLKIKSVAKIREFLLEKINVFKKPMTNYHIPQNTMLKFKFYYKFLMANNREVAKEVRSEYVDTMGKVMFSYFKSYSGRLQKLQFSEAASRDDLLGYDDTAGVSRGGFFSKSAVRSKASVFSMGKRADVLGPMLKAPIIVPHAEVKAEVKHPYEVLFRSDQFSFTENACREYTFVSEFFMVTGNEALDLFHQIMAKTMGMLTKSVDQVVQESYDSISLFLCIHLVYKFRAICHEEKSVTACDKYWDTLLALLWPRLKTLMQLNTQSIKECDPLKMKTVDQRPHYITRRYAEFSAGLLSVNESCPDENVSRLLADMQQEVEHFILKMTSVFEGRKNQLIFLINNYDMILSVIAERSHAESKESDSFKDLLSTRTAEYVEQVLQPHFSPLVRFVQHTEVLLQNNDLAALRREADQNTSSLLRAFNAGWKKSLDSINHEVLSSFPNFKNGTSILQQTLTQFVQYYHRFHKVMSHPAFSAMIPAGDRAQLINVHQLMVEVKKYKPNF